MEFHRKASSASEHNYRLDNYYPNTSFAAKEVDIDEFADKINKIYPEDSVVKDEPWSIKVDEELGVIHIKPERLKNGITEFEYKGNKYSAIVHGSPKWGFSIECDS